jgi:excisionase family DNA binding protein
MEKIYSVKELTDYLKLSEKTVLQLLKADKLKGFKAGREWRVTQTELNKFMKLEG